MSGADLPTSQAEWVPRRLRDATELRARSHPVRLALFEALSMSSQLTATEAGQKSASRRPPARSTCASSPSAASSRRPVAALEAADRAGFGFSGK